MEYTLYAIMKDERRIMLCESNDIELFYRILNNFNVSDNIDRFVIMQAGIAIYTKELLPRKEEGLCLRK